VWAARSASKGWRLRIMADRFFALVFRPDIVKISLDSERTMLA
jgi:hypothetical protein